MLKAVLPFFPAEAFSSAEGGAVLSLNQHLAVVPGDDTHEVKLQHDENSNLYHLHRLLAD